MGKNGPTVRLMDASPLWVAVHAIRKCWKSEGDSDSYFNRSSGTRYGLGAFYVGQTSNAPFVLGDRDLQLLRKIIKHGHESTVEHLKYSFELSDMSRGCLQELARHRIASLSVESSRYTLNRLLRGADEAMLRSLLVSSGDEELDRLNVEHMMKLAALGRAKSLKNDVLKYGLVEAWKTSLDWSLNARALRNFLKLRLSRRAHFEIRALAHAVYEKIPQDHLPIYENVRPMQEAA